MFLFNRRYLRIVFFFGRLAVSIIFWEVVLRKVGFRSLAERTAVRRYGDAARRFRSLAIRLGGVLIKVGQFLSSRVDVLPDYIINELSDLQDEVPPEKYSAIKVVLEQELGPISEHFAVFDEVPLAAASLGQAHKAVLPNGEKVVVKIQRPNIENIVEIDLKALQTAARWIKYWKTVSRRVDVEKLLVEFSVTLREELDYIAEAKNAVRFAKMFKDKPDIRVPRIYNELSTLRVLTLENVYFIKITDYDAITAAGVDRAQVAERLLDTYLYQIFTEYFFHADPHPGNLFVQPADAEHGWRLVFVDFGMVGRITPEARAAMRDAVVALGTRDAARLVHSFVAIGALLPWADQDRLIQAYTVIFDKFWGKSMDELRNMDMEEMHDFFHQFRDLMYEMPFQIPENIIYLGRCISILSGMCTGLNPDFNLFSQLIPFAQTLLAEETKGEGLEFWLNEIKEIGIKLVTLPKRLDAVLSQIEHGEMTVVTRPSREQLRKMDRLTGAVNRLSGGLVFSALLVVGTYLYLNQQQTLGIGGWILSALVLIWTMVRR